MINAVDTRTSEASRRRDVDLVSRWALRSGGESLLQESSAGDPAATGPDGPPPGLRLPRPRTEQSHRDALARELLLGRRADLIAPRFGITLAQSYVVALVPSRSATERTEVDHCDILSTADGTAADARRIVLLPSRLPVRPAELRGFCERLLDCGPDSERGLAAAPVAAAVAGTRADIATALQEVRTVHHVVGALDFHPGVYQLADVPVEAALLRSPDLADLLADRLSPLASSGAPLLETLFVYQDAGQDRRQTAKALCIHPNTLDYRLRRIRELTGLSLTAPGDSQTLSTAATAWRLSHPGPTTTPGDDPGPVRARAVPRGGSGR